MIDIEINEQNRTFIFKEKICKVPDFFNFKNFIKREPKTVDYVLSYFQIPHGEDNREELVLKSTALNEVTKEDKKAPDKKLEQKSLMSEAFNKNWELEFLLNDCK